VCGEDRPADAGKWKSKLLESESEAVREWTEVKEEERERDTMRV
jgi:hypothetical protein